MFVMTIGLQMTHLSLYRPFLAMRLMLLISIPLICHSNSKAAQTVTYSFLEKAKDHYREQAQMTSQRDVAIDSMLRASTTEINFNKASDIAWRIGLYLLEQGKHGAALDIYSDLKMSLEALPEKTKKDKEKISSVLNVIGAIYEETGLWNDALDYYMHSLQVCNEIGYTPGEAKVYNNIGKICFIRNELNKAEELFQKAIVINRKLNNRLELFNNYNNMAGVWQQKKDLKKALEYALIALNQLDIDKDFYDMGIVYSNIGNLYQDMKNYPVALSYFQQAAALQEEKSFDISLLRSYLSISSLYETINNRKLAEDYLNKALELSGSIKNPTQKLLVLQAAAKYYRKTGNYKKSSDFYSLYTALNDSLAALNGMTKVEQVQAVYDVINKEKDNKILAQKVNLQELAIQRQRIVLIAVILIFLLVSFLLFNLQRNRKRERKRNELISRQSESLHKQEKEILLQKEKTLTLEIDYKNRQLTAYALHLARNNEFITKTSEELRKILLELNPRDKERSGRIKQMLSDLQQYSAGSDWEEFRLYFEEVHQSFDKNLTESFPDLSPNDKKICALLKLGLTTKDIASITFREPRSVESARNRLRKKLGLAAEVNIQNFLSQF